MRAREAQLLYTGQVVEFNDGRTARVEQQDTINGQVHLRLRDGTTGIQKWVDMFTIELLVEAEQHGNVS